MTLQYKDQGLEKRICQKLMSICSKHIAGKGKLENLPSTIDGLFKKHKMTYEHLKILTSTIGLDCRKYDISHIAEYVTNMKAQNTRMVSLEGNNNVEGEDSIYQKTRFLKLFQY